MAYVCGTCGGNGSTILGVCQTCNGRGTVVESSQGLTVSWGTVFLGLLTGVKTNSAKVSLEDVTGLNSPVVNYGTHTGMIRQLIAGDLTPGTVDLSWIGTAGLQDSMVGRAARLEIIHEQKAIGLTLGAILMGFDFNLQRGDLIQGSANFQLTEV